MKKIFVTFGYIGFIKPASGTWGSIAGALVAMPILYYLGPVSLCLLSILLFIGSINIINLYENETKTHDSSHIVIDEVAGVWFALAICGQIWLGFLLSVILFRVYDILKPSIIGRIDKNVPGGLGVMADDMVAGGFAGLTSLMIISAMMRLGFERFIF